MLTNLASVVRSSGLTVVEVPGWRTRGHGQMTAVDAIICHHTAGPKTGNYPSLNVVTEGRSDLAGPLSQLGLGRNGTVYVIAAGVAYHAGATFETWQNNWHAIGIEAEATGVDDWPDVQYDAYARLCAALRHGYDVPNDRVLGHKEVAKPKGRKPDPNFDMNVFRAAVARAYAGPKQQEEITVSEADRIINQLNAVSGHLQKNAAQHHKTLRSEVAEMINLAVSGQTEQLTTYMRQLDAANDAEIAAIDAKLDEAAAEAEK